MSWFARFHRFLSECNGLLLVFDHLLLVIGVVAQIFLFTRERLVADLILVGVTFAVVLRQVESFPFGRPEQKSI